MNKIQVPKLAISSIDFEGENSIARSKRIWISQYFKIIPWKKEKPLLDIYQSREAKRWFVPRAKLAPREGIFAFGIGHKLTPKRKGKAGKGGGTLTGQRTIGVPVVYRAFFGEL